MSRPHGLALRRREGRLLRHDRLHNPDSSLQVLVGLILQGSTTCMSKSLATQASQQLEDCWVAKAAKERQMIGPQV